MPSCGTSMGLKDGASAAKVYQTLMKQKVEIVFTAHPTEVMG